MLDHLASEAEIEVLEERLEQQTLRLAEREVKLEEYDALRHRIESEKATLQSEAQERRSQEELERQLQLIEEHEEYQRREDLRLEAERQARDLQERMQHMTPLERERFLADLQELERLEELLATTTETLENRQEAVMKHIEAQEAVQTQLATEQNDCLQECLAVVDQLQCTEGVEWEGLQEQLHELHRAHKEELAQLVLTSKQLQLEQRRNEVFASLPAVEQEHILSLIPEQYTQVLDELHELALLKTKYQCQQQQHFKRLAELA